MITELQESDNELSMFQTNPYDDNAKEPEPLNIDKLKKMAQISPKDYQAKLETLLIAQDSEMRKLRKELKHLRSANTAMIETEEDNRHII